MPRVIALIEGRKLVIVLGRWAWYINRGRNSEIRIINCLKFNRLISPRAFEMASSRRSARKARYNRSNAASAYHDESDEEYHRESRRNRSKGRNRDEEDDLGAPIDEEHGEDLDNAVDDDENLENGAEVTRCICGNQELQLDPDDPYYNDEKVLGLFIQCDKCNVWQHGYCVSIYEEKLVPGKYWCEICRPDLHYLQIGPKGTTSQYIPVQPKLKHQGNAYNNKNKKKARPSRLGRSSESEEEKRIAAIISRSKRTTMNSNDGLLARALRESAKEYKAQGFVGEAEEDKNMESIMNGSRKKRTRQTGNEEDDVEEEENRGELEEEEEEDDDDYKHKEEEEAEDFDLVDETRRSKRQKAENDIQHSDDDNDTGRRTLKSEDADSKDSESNDEKRKRPRRAVYSSADSPNVESSHKRSTSNSNNTVPTIITSKVNSSVPSGSRLKNKVRAGEKSLLSASKSANNSDSNTSGNNSSSAVSRPSRKKKSLLSVSSPHRSRSNGKSGSNGNGTSNGSATQNSILLNADKPIEPRIPSAKISLHEMRKRITAISEFIYYVSVDLTEEQKSYHKLLESFQQRNKDGANSGNTSFASTASSAEDEEEEEMFIKNFQLLFENNQNGSMDMITQLRSKIEDWEVKFGLYELQ